MVTGVFMMYPFCQRGANRRNSANIAWLRENSMNNNVIVV